MSCKCFCVFVSLGFLCFTYISYVHSNGGTIVADRFTYCVVKQLAGGRSKYHHGHRGGLCITYTANENRI